MIRIAEVELNPKKKVIYALTDIYGIGISKSKFILQSLKINPLLKLEQVDELKLSSIRGLIENSIIIENTLKKKNILAIKHLVSIQCYRGKRHQNNLPTNGQRTRTNARTQKNKKNRVENKIFNIKKNK